jgi:hypothetical protein
LAARRIYTGVGVGGGEPGNIAMLGRSLVAEQPCETRVFHEGEARRYVCRRRVVAGGATRFGGGGSQARPPPKKHRHGGFSNKYFRTMHPLRIWLTICVLEQSLPQSAPRYRLFSFSSVRMVIATAHCLYKRPANNVNHRERIRGGRT